MLHAVTPGACYKSILIRLPDFAGLGSALAVGIGYMDPGTGATGVEATRFGNTRIWAVMASGAAAALLQILVVRFAASSGKGLMEAISDRFPRSSAQLWIVYALAIVATEIAELVGLVIGLQMLFGI